MKILYCNKYNFTFSGTEAYLFETMELMRPRGHEVALFSMADERGARTAYDEHFIPHTDFQRNGTSISQLARGVRAIYSIEARRKIRAMIEDFRPDVAHVRNIYHHLTPSILWELKAHGVPVLYHVNDFKVLCPSYNMVGDSGGACERCRGGRFYNVIAEGCYAGGYAASAVLAAEAYLHKWISTYSRCVDLLLAPSEFVKQKFVENGWLAERIRVLPHFQQLPASTKPHPGQSAPILYFGRLSREKGIADVINAMERLPQINLIVAGRGPERGSLQSSTDAKQLRNVSFIGQVTGSMLGNLIAASQFTVFPSHAYETFGKSITESFAQARTVVASDLGSRRELVEHGKTGLLYPVKDVRGLAESIAFLHENPTASQRMGEAGRELVRSQLGPGKHVEILEEIYAQLGSKRAAAMAIARKIRTAAVESNPAASSIGSSRPLRIANIGGRGIGAKYSGIETYYEETGKRLAKMGHEVTIYCRSYFTPKTADPHGMRIVRLPALRTKHLETFTHTLLSTIHACFSSCDIVHYHCLGPALFSWIPRLFGKKTLVTVQGLDWQRRKWGSIARTVLKLGEWESATFPNTTVVVSQVLRKRYEESFTRATTLIPNGTHIRACVTGPHLARFALEANKYVLYLGRFSPEKNCHLLVKAFQQTKSDFQLVLAGGSSHTDEYATRLRRHTSDRIICLDWLSGAALEELLTNAALFVLPSDLEGSSLALLDAMGAGVCVLASDIPENLETMRNAGFTFRRGDVQDLHRMLEFLLANPAIRSAAGRYAQQMVRQNNSWNEIAQQLSNTYAQVLGVERQREQKVSTLKAAA